MPAATGCPGRGRHSLRDDATVLGVAINENTLYISQSYDGVNFRKFADNNCLPLQNTALVRISLLGRRQRY
jgi:hypothetical protein